MPVVAAVLAGCRSPAAPAGRPAADAATPWPSAIGDALTWASGTPTVPPSLGGAVGTAAPADLPPGAEAMDIATLSPAQQLATPMATSKPPEGFLGTSFWSIADAQKAVGFQLLVPDAATLPPDLHFVEAQVLAPPELDFQPKNNIGLNFIGPDMELSIEQMILPGALAPPKETTAYESVSVRGRPGYLVDYSQQPSLPVPGRRIVVMWEEGGVVISLSGSLDREALLRIANRLHPFAAP
jgi:hypothetical protein